MRLDEGDDEVVGMVVANKPDSETIMVVSENGYGKRSAIEDYRITNRGGKGVKTLSITEKTGRLVAIKVVTDDNDLMIINRSGITIRTSVDQIRLAGRATQGVKIINLREGDTIASVMAVPKSEDAKDEELTDVPQTEGAEAVAVETVETVDNSNE